MQNLSERHDFILKRLQQEGHVSVSQLSEQLNVSEVTIRKDLRALEQRNLLFRTHGGASRRNPYVLDRPVDEKTTIHAEEKRRIGEAAARLVGPRDSIILASGTTMVQVARHLQPSGSLTVVTSAMNVALELMHLPTVEVLMLGGLVRHSSASVIGPYAEHILEEHACDKLFLGVDGFDLDYGLTTTNALEAHLNQAMIRAAQRTIVVADSSKFGRRGFRRICGVDDVDLVITDASLPDDQAQALEDRGIEVEQV